MYLRNGVLILGIGDVINYLVPFFIVAMAVGMFVFQRMRKGSLRALFGVTLTGEISIQGILITLISLMFAVFFVQVVFGW